MRHALLLEMLARTVKNLLRERLRLTADRASIADGPFVDAALELFNRLLRAPDAEGFAAVRARPTWGPKFALDAEGSAGASPTMPGMLVWMDLEMTGLDHTRDVIVEIATIVTDDDRGA